jgi:hypothetical protein
MAYSHDAQLVLKAARQHDDFRSDTEQNSKDDVVVLPGNVNRDEVD